jgi:hypothetical protein
MKEDAVGGAEYVVNLVMEEMINAYKILAGKI